MHMNGFCHRDIKPGNVLINSEGKVVLTDFGTCKRLPENEIQMAMGK